LSSAAGEDAWRRFTTKQFSGSEFAWARSVTRFSSFAHTVIEGTAIAARGAASKPASVSGGVLTGVTSRAWKDGSIIATGNESTVSEGMRKLA
jgi:hypothetical protein